MQSAWSSVNVIQSAVNWHGHLVYFDNGHCLRYGFRHIFFKFKLNPNYRTIKKTMICDTATFSLALLPEPYQHPNRHRPFGADVTAPCLLSEHTFSAIP